MNEVIILKYRIFNRLPVKYNLTQTLMEKIKITVRFIFKTKFI
jgi:hypothetical protein